MPIRTSPNEFILSLGKFISPNSLSGFGSGNRCRCCCRVVAAADVADVAAVVSRSKRIWNSVFDSTSQETDVSVSHVATIIEKKTLNGIRDFFQDMWITSGLLKTKINTNENIYHKSQANDTRVVQTNNNKSNTTNILCWVILEKLSKIKAKFASNTLD